MTESPEQRVARLSRELAQAKVEALQAELADAQGTSVPAASAAWLPAAHQSASLPDRFVSRTSAHLESEQPLAPAPRRVPTAFRLVVFPWSWWTAFALFMIATAPIALWLFVPLAGAIVAPVTLFVIVALRVRRDRLQLALLRWGEAATVTAAEVLGVGTYYSGTTYQNVRLAQAHGWHVAREWYSGPATRTRISYQLGATKADLVVHGLPYDGGVILADSRRPERALCVSAFAYDLDRDASGNWIGVLPGRVVFGAVAMTVLLLAWTAAMVLVWGLAAASTSGVFQS